MKLRSWELWYSLYHHPLVNAPLLYKNFTPRTPRRNPLPEASQIGLSIGGVVLTSILCLANLSELMRGLTSLFGTILLALVLGLLLVGTILPGLNLALKVGGAIFREQEKGRYDLLALIPRGAAAVHWALVMRCVRDDVLSRRLRQIIQNIGTLLVLPIVAALLPIALLVLLVFLFNLRLAADFFAVVGTPLLVVALFYIDYIQSTIIAVLLSIVIPGCVYSRSGSGAVWIAPLLFTAGQLLFYLGFVAFFIQLDGFFARAMPADQSLVARFVEALIGLAVLFTLREAVINLLWRLALQHFDDDLRILRLD